MRLAVSCLAWTVVECDDVAIALRRHGASGIEIVPTGLWGDWDRALAAQPADIPPPLSGFARPSMQSLVFGLPDHKLFGTSEAEDRLVDHLGRLIDMAGRLGVRALVFGSPKNRLRGELSPAAAVDRFERFAERLAPRAAAVGALLCLEANPTRYGCDFVTGTPELVEVFERIRRPGFGLHFDTGAALINEEDLPDLIRRVGPALDHFHVSEPGLATFGSASDRHAAFAAALREINYRHWVSIEMLRGPRGIADLDEALRFVARTYGPFEGDAA